MDEIWKKVDGFLNYEVSNLGRVKSLPKLKRSPDMVGWYTKEIIMNQHTDKRYGYKQLELKLANGIGKTQKVHRLVALAFIPNPENYKQVNHINGIKTDNSLENLEWCNNSQNQLHAHRLGLHKKRTGEDHQNSKWTNEQRREIVSLYVNASPKKEILKLLKDRFDISIGSITRLVRSKQWA